MPAILQRLIAATSAHHIDILKNLARVFSLHGLQRLFGIATTYFIVRAISQEQFGEYNLILTYTSVLAIFALPGLKNSTMQSVARHHDKTYCKAIKLTFSGSLIGAAILAAFGIWNLTYTENAMVGYGFLIAAILFPATNGLELWKSMQTGKNDFKRLTRLEGICSVLSSIGIIAGVSIFPGSFLIPLGISLGVVALLNGILSARLYFSLRISDSSVEEGSTAYGIKTSFYMAALILSHNVDRLLVFYCLSPASLAIYAAASRFPDLFKNLFQDTASVLAPHFAINKHYTKRLDRFLKIFSLAMGAIVLLFTFTIFPWLFVLIFGETYREAVPYAQALMCSIAIANTTPLRLGYVKSQLDSKSFRDIAIGLSILKLILSLVFIPWMGLTGAVISAFGNRLIAAAGTYWIIRKRYLLAEE